MVHPAHCWGRRGTQEVVSQVDQRDHGVAAEAERIRSWRCDECKSFF